MDRRRFVTMLGAAAGATWTGTAWPGAGAAPRRLSRIGLELYTVRDAMRRDPERTLAAVRAMGYADVELLWSWGNFGMAPERLRTVLDREGLRAPSAHLNPATLLTGWDRSLALAHQLGHEYLIIPSFTPDTQRSLDDWREWADHFNHAGEAARAAGIWLALHNEPGHMKPLDGVVPYDVFIERTDPRYVRLQLDVGNMALGGGDPFRYLERYRERYWSFHLKDVVADSSRETGLGEGRLDFRRLLAAIPDLAHKPCYVEQEEAADPLASAKRDFAYLQRLEF
jgi:sugar phosphate isomerase/epimerase